MKNVRIVVFVYSMDVNKIVEIIKENNWEIENVGNGRVEFICLTDKAKEMILKIKSAHLENVDFDVYPLLGDGDY